MQYDWNIPQQWRRRRRFLEAAKLAGHSRIMRRFLVEHAEWRHFFRKRIWQDWRHVDFKIEHSALFWK